MKILLDTNVLLPALKHPQLRRKLIWKIIEEGMTPVVTDFILEELRENIGEQYTEPQKAVALDLLLLILETGRLEVKQWEEYAPYLEEALALIPEKDAPILAAVMLPDVDLFVTNDEKHFLKNQKLRGTPWAAKIRSPIDFLRRLEEGSS